MILSSTHCAKFLLLHPRANITTYIAIFGTPNADNRTHTTTAAIKAMRFLPLKMSVKFILVFISSLTILFAIQSKFTITFSITTTSRRSGLTNKKCITTMNNKKTNAPTAYFTSVVVLLEGLH